MLIFAKVGVFQESVDTSICHDAHPMINVSFCSFSVNGNIPVTFLIFQTSKLFQSPDQENQLSRSRRLAVGTRVISATVEGAIIQDLPQGQEVETAFLQLNVRSKIYYYSFYFTPYILKVMCRIKKCSC